MVWTTEDPELWLVFVVCILVTAVSVALLFWCKLRKSSSGVVDLGDEIVFEGPSGGSPSQGRSQLAQKRNKQQQPQQQQPQQRRRRSQAWAFDASDEEEKTEEGSVAAQSNGPGTPISSPTNDSAAPGTPTSTTTTTTLVEGKSARASGQRTRSGRLFGWRKRDSNVSSAAGTETAGAGASGMRTTRHHGHDQPDHPAKSLPRLLQSLRIEAEDVQVTKKETPLDSRFKGRFRRPRDRQRSPGKFTVEAEIVEFSSKKQSDQDLLARFCTKYEGFVCEYIQAFYGLCQPQPNVTWLLLEQLPPCTLLSAAQELHKQHRPLMPHEQLHLLSQVTSALHYLHGNNICHGYLRLSECHLTPQNTVRIVSFDAFRRLQLPYTQDDDPYNAPELLQNRAAVADAACDLWSFAVLAWQLAHPSAQPYQTVPPGRLLSYVQGGGRLERTPGIQDELYDVLMQCWSLRAAERPRTEDLHRQMLDLRYQHAAPLRPLTDLLPALRPKSAPVTMNYGAPLRQPNLSDVDEDDEDGEDEISPYAMATSVLPQSDVSGSRHNLPNGRGSGAGGLWSSDSGGGGGAHDDGDDDDDDDDDSLVDPSAIYAQPIKKSDRVKASPSQPPPLPSRTYDRSSVRQFLHLSDTGNQGSAPTTPRHAMTTSAPGKQRQRGLETASEQRNQRYRGETQQPAVGVLPGTPKEGARPAAAAITKQTPDTTTTAGTPSSTSLNRSGGSIRSHLAAGVEEDDKAHLTAPWYLANSQKKAAQNLMKASDMEDGTFLVRPSKTGDSFVLLVAHDGNIHTYRIHVEEGAGRDKCDYHINAANTFPTLSRLIEFYRRPSLPPGTKKLRTRLCSPCQRPVHSHSYTSELASTDRSVTRRQRMGLIPEDDESYPMTEL